MDYLPKISKTRGLLANICQTIIRGFRVFKKLVHGRDSDEV